MRVEDVMSVNPLYVGVEEYVTHAREIMRDNNIQCLPVVQNGRYQGMIIAQDIVNITSTKSNVTVDGYLRLNVATVNPSTDLAEAARRVIESNTGRIAVVRDGGQLTGVLSIVDIFKGIEELGVPDMPVREVMHKDFTVVTPGEHISRVWANMIEYNFRGFPVVREDQTVIGMITREDILRRGYVRFERENESPKYKPSTVEMIMSTPAITINEDESLRKAAKIFTERSFSHLPVLKDGRLSGVMDRRDVLKVCRRLVALG
jgi:CBS domain-containing protein